MTMFAAGLGTTHAFCGSTLDVTGHVQPVKVAPKRTVHSLLTELSSHRKIVAHVQYSSTE